MATRTLNIVIAGDSSGAQRAFAQADQAAGELDTGVRAKMRSVGERFKEVGTRMMGVGKKMSLAITLPVVAIGRASLEHAREARVAMSEVNTIFGDSAHVVQSWAREHAHSLGLSEAQMVSLSNATGGLGITLGMTGGEASMFTLGTNEIAAALSNARPDVGNFEDAVEDLSGGFFGNREQLKKWGLNIKQADIDAKLAAKGLEGLTGESRNQAEAWAILEIATEGSALSLERFRKNGVDPALEAQNRLKAETREASEEFGANLEPIIEKVQKALTRLMRAFNNLSPGMQQAITYGVLVLAVLGPMLVVGGALIKVVGGIMIALAALSAPVLIVIAVIAALVVVTILLIKHWDKVKAAMGAVWDWIKNAASGVLDWFKSNWPLLLPIILGPIGVVATLVIKHWDTIRNAVMTAVTAVRNAITTGFNAVKDFIVRWWPFIIGLFTGGLGTLVVMVVRNWSTIRQRTVAIFTAIRDFFVRIWNAIRDFVVRTVGNLRDRVVGVFTNARDRMRDIIQAAREAVVSRVEGMRDTVVRVAVGLKDRIIQAFKDMRAGMASWMRSARDAVLNVWDSLVSRTKTPINKIIGFINSLIGGIGTFIGAIPGISNPLKGIRIPKLAKGGIVDVAAEGPFMTNGPMAIVGEGKRQFPEYVIPTDPAHRSRALGLAADMFSRLGLPKFSVGDWLSPSKWVEKGKDWIGGASSAITGVIRAGAAKVFEAAANQSLKLVPKVFWARDIGKAILDRVVEWVRGVDEGALPDIEGSGLGTIKGLVGHAAAAYREFRKIFPTMNIGGWRAQGSVPGSDHPKGKALDLMTFSNAVAQRIIGIFMGQAGKKYWIWNRQVASAAGGWRPRGYSGPSPHTDHVHLSYFHKGGLVDRDGPAMLQRGERVFSRRQVQLMEGRGGGGMVVNHHGDVILRPEIRFPMSRSERRALGRDLYRGYVDEQRVHFGSRTS